MAPHSERSEEAQMAQEFRALGLPSLHPTGAFDGDRWQRTLAEEAHRTSRSRARRWGVWALTASGLAAIMFMVSLLPLFRPPTADAVASAILSLHDFAATVQVQQKNAAGTVQTVSAFRFEGSFSGPYHLQSTGANGQQLDVYHVGSWLQVQNGARSVWRPAFPDPYVGYVDLRPLARWLQASGQTQASSVQIGGKTYDRLSVAVPGSGNWQVTVDPKNDLPVQIVSPMVDALQYSTNVSWSAPSSQTYHWPKPPQYPVANMPSSLHLGVWRAAWGVAYQGLDLFDLTAGSQQALLVTGPLPRWNGTLTLPLNGGGTLLAQNGITSLPEFGWQFQGLVASPMVVPVVQAENLQNWSAVRLGNVEIIAKAPLGTVQGWLAQLVGRAISPATVSMKPSIAVPADLDTARAEQAQVDMGNSPWLTDPVAVAQAWTDGRTHQVVPASDFRVAYHGNATAIVQVTAPGTSVARIYLRQLVRTGPSGIWSVTGYDQR